MDGDAEIRQNNMQTKTDTLDTIVQDPVRLFDEINKRIRGSLPPNHRAVKPIKEIRAAIAAESDKRGQYHRIISYMIFSLGNVPINSDKGQYFKEVFEKIWQLWYQRESL